MCTVDNSDAFVSLKRRQYFDVYYYCDNLLSLPISTFAPYCPLSTHTRVNLIKVKSDQVPVSLRV